MTNLLQPLGTGQGFLKAGLLGFQKSGKTYTAALLACATRKAFNLKGPIAMFDTEGGSEYIGPMVRELTGGEFLGVKSRSFDDLVALGKQCVDAGVAVLIADSMTHVWRELCEAYLKGINDQRKKNAEHKGLPPPRLKTGLEFQDWSTIKGAWGKWTDFYLNAPLHTIIAGRAGFIYDFETNEETGKKELIKTGIKMKTEGEFGFEPSLLIEMDSEQKPDGQGGFTFARTATVLGDRFGILDGSRGTFPGLKKPDKTPDHAAEMVAVEKFFGPHLAMLRPGAHSTIDTDVKSHLGVDGEGDADWQRERKSRTIVSEEVQGVLVSVFPGQSAQEKKAKADILQECFGTRSWTAIESMDSGKLRVGLAKMREKLKIESRQAEPPPATEPAPAAAEV